MGGMVPHVMKSVDFTKPQKHDQSSTLSPEKTHYAARQIINSAHTIVHNETDPRTTFSQLNSDTKKEKDFSIKPV